MIMGAIPVVLKLLARPVMWDGSKNRCQTNMDHPAFRDKIGFAYGPAPLHNKQQSYRSIGDNSSKPIRSVRGRPSPTESTQEIVYTIKPYQILTL